MREEHMGFYPRETLCFSLLSVPKSKGSQDDPPKDVYLKG